MADLVLDTARCYMVKIQAEMQTHSEGCKCVLSEPSVFSAGLTVFISLYLQCLLACLQLFNPLLQR